MRLCFLKASSFLPLYSVGEQGVRGAEIIFRWAELYDFVIDGESVAALMPVETP